MILWKFMLTAIYYRRSWMQKLYILRKTAKRSRQNFLKASFIKKLEKKHNTGYLDNVTEGIYADLRALSLLLMVVSFLSRKKVWDEYWQWTKIGRSAPLEWDHYSCFGLDRLDSLACISWSLSSIALGSGIWSMKNCHSFAKTFHQMSHWVPDGLYCGGHGALVSSKFLLSGKSIKLINKFLACVENDAGPKKKKMKRPSFISYQGFLLIEMITIFLGETYGNVCSHQATLHNAVTPGVPN